ncbi:MAG: T9SS type A sorting domain-containing protein [Bacteroidota bacterium]|nr:T9SS type A sorting domain-containing protein [Bacteroidota bacterium]
MDTNDCVQLLPNGAIDPDGFKYFYNNLYVKWKNIEANANTQLIWATYHTVIGNNVTEAISVGPFTLNMPSPTFSSGTSHNIPCYVATSVTIALNPYINTLSNKIDSGLVITSQFEWTLPSGWRTTTGQTGTFVSSSSISVIPPASTSNASISVKAKANTQYSQPATIQITRNLEAFTIAGPTNVVYNSSYRFEVPSFPGVSYSWQLPNGWTGSSNTNYIDVTVGCIYDTITATITGCNQSISASKTNTLNYIIPGTQINGPDVVCFSGTTFVINKDVPIGTTILWNTSFNLTLTSQNGNSATFNANFEGSGWIEAILNNTTCNYSVTLPRKTVWMSNYYLHVTRPDGYPVTNDEYGNLSLCSYTDYLINIRPKDYVPCYTSDHNWEVPSTWTINYIDGSFISINTNEDPNNFIAVNAKSCCFDDVYCSYYFEYSSSCAQYLMVFSPNPSTSETTLSISTKSGTKVNDKLEWDLEVYDSMQNLKTKTQKLKGDKKAINTTGWKDGVYIVRIKIGNEIISEKLVVKH